MFTRQHYKALARALAFAEQEIAAEHDNPDEAVKIVRQVAGFIANMLDGDNRGFKREKFMEASKGTTKA